MSNLSETLKDGVEDIIHKWLKENLELGTETNFTATRVVLKLRGEEISAVTIYHG